MKAANTVVQLSGYRPLPLQLHCLARLQKCIPTMGPAQLLSPSKLSAAQSSIQAGGDGVRDGVAMMLEAISEYNDMQGADGVNGSQVWCTY